MADWSNLPKDLLALVLERLISNFLDMIRFRAVCKSWRFILLKKPSIPPPQLPLLMVSRPGLMTLYDNRVCSLTCGNFCCCFGSSHGWLFIVENNYTMSMLMNPMTNVRIPLPHIQSVLPRNVFTCLDWMNEFMKGKLETFVVKAVLSLNPSFKADEDCFVMVISPGGLSFCKLGDSHWTRVIDTGSGPYEDVVFFKGKFCAVNVYGRIVVCDVSCPPSETLELKAPESFRSNTIYYLVESDGKLLLVKKFRGWSLEVYKALAFQVLEQDPISKDWVQVKELGNHALFLGYNHSLSLSASEVSGCKGNCIYFTDNCFINYKGKDYDGGIFNLADGHIEPFPGYTSVSKVLKQPPLWITASPW